MRCFVALDLPVPVRNHLANVVRPMHGRYQVRWVEPEHMHATLLFAGDIDDDTTDDLASILDELPLGPMSLHLDQLGHVPPRGVPRVLWAGLGGDIEVVDALQAELAERGEDLGIERDPRGFTPHVTLGRVKSPFGALALIDDLQELAAQLKPKPFAPTALTLYASELLPSGPVYEVIATRPCPTAAADDA